MNEGKYKFLRQIAEMWTLHIFFLVMSVSVYVVYLHMLTVLPSSYYILRMFLLAFPFHHLAFA